MTDNKGKKRRRASGGFSVDPTDHVSSQVLQQKYFSLQANNDGSESWHCKLCANQRLAGAPSDRLPAVAALTNPLTWTLLHFSDEQRTSAWAELKRLFYIEYVKDNPQVPPPPAPPPIPLVAPNDNDPR